MTEKEMVKRSLQALAEFDRLPPEEQVRILVAAGTIDEKGEVLFGRDEARKQEQQAERGTATGAPE